MEQNKAERLNENVTEKMCSSDGNVVGEMCSPADADTYRDGMRIVQTGYPRQKAVRETLKLFYRESKNGVSFKQHICDMQCNAAALKS